MGEEVNGKLYCNTNGAPQTDALRIVAPQRQFLPE
jgi:hypothetical protein